MPDTIMPGIYIHIPFCLSKCAYCAFVSYPVKNFDPDIYLAALYREIDFWSKRCPDEQFSSIFIGGGTPTVLPDKDLAALLARLQEKFTISAEAEISVETNPNTIDQGKAATLRQAGVNRLSIGIQSLNDRTLQLINRTHTADEGRRALQTARQAGFDNINLDLIYGLPEQTGGQWRATLEEAIILEPEHLAIYQLSIDSGSRFAGQLAKGKLQLPTEDLEAEMYEETVRIMADSSYQRYEISNYAKPGKHCQHNMLYWQNETYLGLGAGAVSFRSGLRIRNTPDPVLYEKRLRAGEPPWLDSESLPREASFRETVIMGLRLIDGVDLKKIFERFGIDTREYYGETLEKLLEDKLVKIDSDRLKLTTEALPVANQVLSELV